MQSPPETGSGSAQPDPVGTAGSPSSSPGPTVQGFGRPLGMPIGRGASGGDTEEAPSNPELVTPAGDPSEEPGELEIPIFEAPSEAPPPCSGCVELSAIVNDINQSSNFSFDAGGVQVSRVVWTILLPFNSDQLFIRSFVNGTDGPYTFMSANVFPDLNTPVEFVQSVNASATTVSLRIGSAGAWTGDQRVSVFVDSVTLEGPLAVTKTFDTDLEGMVAQGAERSPLVELHP